jgi:hypothetical protein
LPTYIIQIQRNDQIANLHNKALEADSIKSITITVIELEIVMEDETGLHVRWHGYPHRGCTWIHSTSLAGCCGTEQLTCTFPHIMSFKPLVPLNKSVYIFSSYLTRNTLHIHYKDQLANAADCEIHTKTVSKPCGQHEEFFFTFMQAVHTETTVL